MYAGLPDMPPHARPKLGSSARPSQADENEIATNPRARSARLRVAERLDPRSRRMKHRRFLPLVMPLLWLAVLGSAVQVIYARHKARDMFVHLEKLNAERDSLDMEWGRLQLEQSYWSSNAFVERVANAKLQMNLPQTRDVRIVRQ